MSNGPFRSELFAFADAFIERSAALNPIAATDFGIDGYDHELTDFSLAHDERDDRIRALVAHVLWPPSRRPTTSTAIGKNVMTERLTATLGLDSQASRGVPSRCSDVPRLTQIRQVFAIQRAENAEDADKIRSRLAAVRQALESWQSALDEDSRGGGQPPAVRPSACPPSSTRLPVARSGGWLRVWPARAGSTAMPPASPPPELTPTRSAPSSPAGYEPCMRRGQRRPMAWAPNATDPGRGISPVPTSTWSKSTNGVGPTCRASTPACGRSQPTWRPGPRPWPKWQHSSTPTRAGPSMAPTSSSQRLRGLTDGAVVMLDAYPLRHR
jgi:hypothetical protein